MSQNYTRAKSHSFGKIAEQKMSFIDMMMNSLSEIWNLVGTESQTGQATTKDAKFTLLYLGTTNVCLFPFSSARVSYEILSMASLFSM